MPTKKSLKKYLIKVGNMSVFCKVNTILCYHLSDENP